MSNEIHCLLVHDRNFLQISICELVNNVFCFAKKVFYQPSSAEENRLSAYDCQWSYSGGLTK